MKILTVIPARYDSTRFPGKPLADIAGQSMISRVYEKCTEVIEPKDVYVATDSDLIYEHCIENKMNVVMTSNNCLTGTDRLAEFSHKMPADYYINVQGDEPLIDPNDILKIKDAIVQYQGSILNGFCEIEHRDLFYSLTIPKVVFSNNKKLLYMSRAPIPGNKEGEFKVAYRQICVYAFPANALHEFYKYDRKTQFENIEDIEILRFLELGFDVQMIELSNTSIPVDTPEDLEKVLKVIDEFKR